MFSLLYPWEQQVLFACSVGGAVAATILQHKGRSGWALGMLTFTALLLRLFAIHLDPFLNQWDECFHAVVARNMVEHPFTPMLHREPAMSTTGIWTDAHVWLHKPPFFLWQMALSIKLFGAEPWAVRVPSALWLTALVPVSYRIARLLTDQRVAWGTAMFLTFSYYLEELVSGAIDTDHNDAIFIATVVCSWWALLELWNDGRRRWAMLAGLFSACAILTKWYLGLSVFLPWGIVSAIGGFRRKAMLDFLFGAGTTLILAGSWIAIIVFRFPEQAAYEWSFKAEHFSQPMGGHGGGWDYHFEVIRQVLPPFSPWYVLPAFGWLVWKIRRMEHRVFLIGLFIAVHALFAGAQTKMISYTMALLPFYMMALAQAIISLADMGPARYHSPAMAIVVPALAFWMLDLPHLHHHHTIATPPFADQRWRRQQIDSLMPMARLEKFVKGTRPVAVFHIPALHHLQFMFNTGNEASYQLPDRSTVGHLISNGYDVYAVQDGTSIDRFPPGVILIPDSIVLFPNVGRIGL